MKSSKFFAVIPAAGKSERMGQPKLLMPWRGKQVIDAVLAAWTTSRVDQVVVVLRNDSQSLIDACQSWPVNRVTLEEPTDDMKASIIAGIDWANERFAPKPEDQLLIAPADLPGITHDSINQVCDADTQGKIAAPYYGSKRGHPIRIPWHLTGQIRELGKEHGLNSLVDASQICRIDLDANQRPRDIDTPEDYERELQS